MPKPTRRKLSARRLLAIRLAELRRLIEFRETWGEIIDPEPFAIVAADALAQQKQELDFHTFEAWRKGLNEAQALRIIHAACGYFEKHPRHRGMSATSAGRKVMLTVSERAELRITTIAAVGDSKVAREARRRDAKRARDRERARLKRAETGSVSREEYLAGSLARRKPWEIAGESRASWYRKRRTEQAETGPSPGVYSSLLSRATDLSHSGPVTASGHSAGNPILRLAASNPVPATTRARPSARPAERRLLNTEPRQNGRRPTPCRSLPRVALSPKRGGCR